jgi:ATP-binding protein involved in chromosome partitioning
MNRMPTRDEIMKALEVVIDPELHRSIVELDMVRSIDVSDNGVADVTVSLTTPGCPIKGHFQTAVAEAVTGLDGITHCNVYFDVLSDTQKQALQQKLGRGSLPQGALAQVSNVICIGSGKGGVGKSTLTANLAAALAGEGKRVGVLDADVWGYSIPRMYGLGSTAGVGGAQDHPAGGARREGDVDRLLRRGGRGGGVARADAAQGAHAVPAGRRLGRA